MLVKDGPLNTGQCIPLVPPRLIGEESSACVVSDSMPNNTTFLSPKPSSKPLCDLVRHVLLIRLLGKCVISMESNLTIEIRAMIDRSIQVDFQ